MLALTGGFKLKRFNAFGCVVFDPWVLRLGLGVSLTIPAPHPGIAITLGLLPISITLNFFYCDHDIHEPVPDNLANDVPRG